MNLLKKKLLSIQRENLIGKKDDWFRLEIKKNRNLLSLLKIIHPNNRWHSSFFSLKCKKANQRKLFIYLSILFNFRFKILENYRHPKFISNSNYKNSHLELDFFIPSLNFAIEYQGEQHYDDLPDIFLLFCFIN